MTDINTSEDLGGVYNKLLSQLAEIDQTLDATKDQKTAGKRLLRKEMIENNAELWQPVVEKIVERINGYETEDQKYAMFYAIATALNNSFADNAEKYITGIVDSSPVPEKLVLSDDEMKQLTERRSTIYKHSKTVRELAIMFGGTEEEFPVPKRRSGGSGVRGKRAISLYTWTVNGDPFTEEPPLVKLAEKYGFGTSTAFRKALMQQLELADLRDPPSPLVFNLPDGAGTLIGVRPEGVEGDEDDDDDEDDDENGEDTE